MTSTQFDVETSDRLSRIIANPNPRVEGPFRRIAGSIRRCLAWGRSLDRSAAIDSLRNVLAVLGAGTILADFGTMRVWMLAPCTLVLVAVWYADYLRHF